MFDNEEYMHNAIEAFIRQATASPFYEENDSKCLSNKLKQIGQQMESQMEILAEDSIRQTRIIRKLVGNLDDIATLKIWFDEETTKIIHDIVDYPKGWTE